MKDSGEDDVCLITNLPRYRCDHCIGTDPAARAQVRRTNRTRTITAKHRGICKHCNDPIEIGEQIRSHVDGVGWVHADHDVYA